MSKVLKVQAPDGTIIKVEGPAGAPDEQFIQQGAALYQQQQTIKAAQAAKYPTSAELGGKPGSVAPSPEYAGVTGKLAQLGHVLTDTAPGADTGNGSTSIPGLDALREGFAGAIPGSAATAGMGAVEAVKNSPAASVVQSIKDAIPTTAKAGAKFEQVMGAAKDVPIDTSTAEEVLARAKELRQRGSTMPKVMNDFSKNRVAATGDVMGTPVADPMTYEVGRDFASNAGALSTREITAMNGKMQRQVAQFASAMKDANREAAASVGMGALYDQAMKEYRQAKTLEAAGKSLIKWGVRAAMVTAGGEAAYKLFNISRGR